MRIFQSKPSRKRPRIGSTKGNPLARCQVKLLSHGITEGCQVSKSLFTVKIPEACITHITKQNTGGHGGLNQGSKKRPICWSGMSRFSSWESNLIRKLTCLLGFDWENFGLLDRWSHKRGLHVKVQLYFFTYRTLFWDPTRETWQRSFKTGSCICYGQQKGMGRTYKISAGAPK